MHRTNRDYEGLRESLVRKLRESEVNADIVTMPDFFLDHSLTYGRDAKSLTARLLSVASRGGGEIPDIPQELEVGGNAAICTLSLAALGARVHPIMKTNALGVSLMKYFYDPLAVDLTHIKADGDLSPTIILELKHRKRRVNVMVGDVAHVSEFGFTDLDRNDLETMKNANHVCVFNWLYNRKGTELAEKVFRYCKEQSRARTFFDPADPRPRRSELSDLASKVMRAELLDGLGLNENEALTFASLFDKKMGRSKRKGSVGASALEAGKTISANTGVKVYVHTAYYSSSITEKHVTFAPSFTVPIHRGTGAGDNWNAGIIIGENMILTEEEKLLLANALAARYISNPRRLYSKLENVVDFLRNPAHRLSKVASALRT